MAVRTAEDELVLRPVQPGGARVHGAVVLREDAHPFDPRPHILTVDGNELYYTYTVDNQAIVVPENIDAIRALTGTVDDGGESIRRTDRALGVRQDFVRSSVAAR